MENIQIILFDLGNTLTYFEGDWDMAINAGIQNAASTLVDNAADIPVNVFTVEYRLALENYYKERDVNYQEISNFTLLNNLLLKKFNITLSVEDLNATLDAFYAETQKYWKLDPNAIHVLDQLKKAGFRLGLISNAAYAPDVYAQLNQYRLKEYFEQILISAEVGVRKPHLHIFQKALDYFGVPASQTVMVGDTLSADIIGARKMGMNNVWVCQRTSQPSAHYQDEIILPDHTIYNLKELPSLLVL